MSVRYVMALLHSWARLHDALLRKSRGLPTLHRIILMRQLFQIHTVRAALQRPSSSHP